MHRKELTQITLDPTDAINYWATFLNKLDSRDHSKMEYQGYAFAGLILVPKRHLAEQFDLYSQQVLALVEEAKNKGVSRHNYLKYAIEYMATTLSPVFDVSTDALTRRINSDRLYQKIP